MDAWGINLGREQIAIESVRGIFGRCPPSGGRAKDKKTAGLTGGFVDQNIGETNPRRASTANASIGTNTRKIRPSSP
jgi:hypothetical protein